MNKLLALARPEIVSLQPYQHAAWRPTLERLHANEMPWPPISEYGGDDSSAGLNRYPEPQPKALVDRLASLYSVRREQVLVGRGSDEAIDLLIRAFCRAGQDQILVCPPTYSMYKVTANIQGASVVEVPLQSGFALDRKSVVAAWRDGVKLIFLCSPNNPTGNLLDAKEIRALCTDLDGKALIVVDEAYIEFARAESLTKWLDRYPNLVVLRTLSKAYALAGARCGTVLAHPDIIGLLARIIQPYSMPSPTVDVAMKFTSPSAVTELRKRVDIVHRERERLVAELSKSPLIRRIFASEANFLLLDCNDADRVLNAAIEVGLIIRDQRSQKALPSGVRISVGTPEQNSRLIGALTQRAGAAA
ncbi:MAG TPA: histidinol-phosphate transaminase [Steroidobacteraceae bacterium]|nr:histidinol-phosphate transaminase [Steroidobacteraceae bacterium]